MKKTKYEKPFKIDAVKLSLRIGTKKAAKQLGISPNTLNDWRYNQIGRNGLMDTCRKETKSMCEPETAQVPSNKDPTIETLLHRHLDIANRAYMHGDLDTTISLTEQIIHAQPVFLAEALYLRAKCYYYGIQGNRDLYAAESLLLKASDLGHRKAQNLLGVLYACELDRDDIRHSMNYSKAFNLFKEAADSGDPEAMVNEGICHFWGLGTVENPERAVELFKAAIEQLAIPSSKS